MSGGSCREAGHVQASPERRPATSLPTAAFAPARGILFARLKKVEDRMSLVERFVNMLQVISASAPLQWVQLGGLASATWPN